MDDKILKKNRSKSIMCERWNIKYLFFFIRKLHFDSNVLDVALTQRYWPCDGTIIRIAQISKSITPITDFGEGRQLPTNHRRFDRCSLWKGLWKGPKKERAAKMKANRVHLKWLSKMKIGIKVEDLSAYEEKERLHALKNIIQTICLPLFNLFNDELLTGKQTNQRYPSVVKSTELWCSITIFHQYWSFVSAYEDLNRSNIWKQWFPNGYCSTSKVQLLARAFHGCIQD